MKYLLFGLVLVIAVAAVVAALLAKKRGGVAAEKPEELPEAEKGPLPYKKRRWLLSKAEKSFYLVLCGTLPPDLVVFTKVRLADAIEVREGTRQRMRAFNKISAKHLDFLICDRQSLEPRIGVELDDQSHEREDREARDEFVEAACRDAGLPLLRVKAAMGYSQPELARQIADLMPKPAPQPAKSKT